MKIPKIAWTEQPLFKKVPLLLVLIVAVAIGFNVYLNLKIKNTQAEVTQIERAAVIPPRVVNPEFAKKIDLGEKQCPYQKAGNPNARLKFKVFQSETCPYCVAEDKVMDQLIPEYGDLFYGEWYEVIDCPKESEQYKIYGVPTFIFNADGVEKEPAYGFLDKQQLTDYICKVSGEC